jgi:FlaA1/EpsC-like NDP-sugar epimerase
MTQIRAGLFRLAHTSRRHKRMVLLAVDAASACVAIYLTCALLFSQIVPWGSFSWLLPLIPIVAATAGLFSMVFGLPQIKLKSYESVAILKTAAMATLTTAALFAYCVVRGVYLPGVGIILFGLILFLLSVASRMTMLQVLMWSLRQGRAATRVVIYGAGKTGMQLAAALRSHEDIVAVAFVDDNEALQNMTVSGLRVYAPGRIEHVVRDRDVARVLLAMPSVSAPKLAQITRRLQALGLEVQALPSFAQLIGTEELIDNLGPVEARQFLGRKSMSDTLPQGGIAYAGRTVLVSGAGGSVGSELCRQLMIYRPRKLVLFEVSEPALYQIDRELRDLPGAVGIEIVPLLGSVMDSRVSRSAMADHGVEVVFHAAAYKHVPLVEANPLAGIANNVLGTRTFADAALETGVGQFVLISTDKAVRPTNVMGATKRMAELVLQDIAKRSPHTVFSMVRFGNVLGSSGSVVPLFKDQIARGGPVTLTHEDVTRYFMTITEAARLVLLAASFAHAGGSRGGDVYVLDMGKAMKIRHLAEQMIQAAGYTVQDADHPEGDIEIVVTGLRPGEKLHEELLIGEGLLTTPHPKILRAQEESLSELEMANALATLRSAVGTGDAAAARAVLEARVEGYDLANGTVALAMRDA